ncbi:transposase [Streptomyces pseudovenezuelae]|uniref:transposase n=1 Tax=Streptomyces pseudovenezuelae TaxID=67350 RepID=UPI00380B1221
MWRWVAQAEIDRGEAPGGTIEENKEIRRLWSQNRRLGEDVAILKAVTTFLVGELECLDGDGRGVPIVWGQAASSRIRAISSGRSSAENLLASWTTTGTVVPSGNG